MNGVVISKHIKKLILASFGITIVLVLVLGLFSIAKMLDLARQTEKLYQHPYSVSNSTKNIQLNFISMHRYMKDIPLSKNDKQLQKAIREIRISEVTIDKEFEFIISRYLGEKKDIQKVQDAFIEWKIILDKCLKLMKQGKKDEAACFTRNQGEEHVQKVNKLISYLINFANTKAEYFLKSSADTMHSSIYIIVILLPTIIAIIISIMIYLIKSMLRVHTHLQKQQEVFLMQSRMAQMGEMISMIAHQWRQPLAVISAIAMNVKLKLTLDSFDLAKEEERQKCVDFLINGVNEVETNIENLIITLSDFRNFYKPNRAPVFVSITQPIDKALSIMDSSFKTDNIKLIQDCDSDTKLNLYENEFIQVLINILKNAQDNLNERKVQSPKVSITTKTSEDTITLSICDNGGGIDETILSKIFEPYFSTKDEANGTGLGLHMSKIIIEDHHNGKIKAINQNGGACFIIELGLDQ